MIINKVISDITLYLTLFTLGIAFPQISNAMENSKFIIDVEDSNVSNYKNVSQDNISLDTNTDTVKSENYTLHMPDRLFNNLKISLSSNLINFGLIKPGEAILRNEEINIESKNGYQLLSYQNHELQDGNKNKIPNTSCDNGDCTANYSGKWASPLTYGFGYNCKSDSLKCIDIFNTDEYRPFSNSLNTLLSTYAKPDNIKSSDIIEITYKLNISATQPNNSSYRNSIFFIAVPNY